MSWEWVVVGVVALLLFGGKRLPQLAKDLGKGIRSFRKALTEPDEDEKPYIPVEAKPVEEVRALEDQSTNIVSDSPTIKSEDAKKKTTTKKKAPAKKTSSSKKTQRKSASKKTSTAKSSKTNKSKSTSTRRKKNTTRKKSS